MSILNKFMRFRRIFALRGIRWTLVNILAELRIFLWIASLLNSLINSKMIRSFLLELGGSSVNQLWNERQLVFKDTISEFLSQKNELQLKNLKIMEIGSWAGSGSSTFFREIIEKCGHMVQIDKWGSDYQGTKSHISKSAKLMANNILSAQILNSINNNSLGPEVSSRITTIRSTTKNLKLFSCFLPEFDVIYLDGSHLYDDIKWDLQFALKSLKSGGLLCGDDLEFGLNPTFLSLAKNNLDQDLVVMNDGQAFHPGVYMALLESGLKIKSSNGFWWINIA
jgi:hypothetical protein